MGTSLQIVKQSPIRNIPGSLLHFYVKLIREHTLPKIRSHPCSQGLPSLSFTAVEFRLYFSLSLLLIANLTRCNFCFHMAQTCWLITYYKKVQVLKQKSHVIPRTRWIWSEWKRRQSINASSKIIEILEVSKKYFKVTMVNKNSASMDN